MKLAEKYRPRRWSEVVGQDKLLAQIQTLKAGQGLAGECYWITGAGGTGKTTVALLLAGEVAAPMDTLDLVSNELDRRTVDHLVERMRLRGLGKQGGRAVIVNEAHGLRDDTTRRLLTVLEHVPPHCVWIFTTTVVGHQTYLRDHNDGDRLYSRCIPLALARRGLADPYAARAQWIAQRESLDGKPVAAYRRLMQECRNDLRKALERVALGEMLPK